MSEDLDAAIDTATARIRQAERRFTEEPIESPEMVEAARTVERRADDLHELATDAADEGEALGPSD